MADFDRIAGLYNRLKKFIFGSQLDDASNYFLDQIPSRSKILIIGGGAGEILKNFTSSQQIQYLELSTAMINRAQKVNSSASIEFIQSDLLEWKPIDKYDTIITSFVLDCFNENQLNLIFPKLKNALNTGGEWIQTDFYPKNRAQNVLVKMMYIFFKLFTNLKTNRLSDFDAFFKKYNFIFKRKALFYHSMVESKIYQKID